MINMSTTVDEWFKKNCRPTSNNRMVCTVGNRVEVIDPVGPDLADEPATEENIEKLIERSKSKGFK